MEMSIDDMTPQEVLIAFLQMQDHTKVASRDWQSVRKFTISEEEDGTDVTVNECDITFVFDKEGRFVGISNFKD